MEIHLIFPASLICLIISQPSLMMSVEEFAHIAKSRCHSRLTKLTDASFMTPLVTCGCLILPHNLQMKGMKKHRLVLLEKSVRTMVLRWIALQVNGTVIWVSACAFTQMHGGTQIEQVLFLCDTTGLDATQQPLNQLYSFLVACV